MAQETFTIDKVAWHTQTPGNPETREQIVARFFAVVSFLQQHGLTNRMLASSLADISDDFSIEASDLTETGLEVMRKAYDKWVRKMDKGMSPSDTSLLAKALPRQ
jgi:stress-induced morphogen